MTGDGGGLPRARTVAWRETRWGALLLASGAVAARIAGWRLPSSILRTLGHPVREQPIIVPMIRSADPFALPGIALLAPIGEELLFRRVVFPTRAAGNGRVVACAATTVAFAVIHFHPKASAGHCIVGLRRALADERTGRLGAPLLVHVLHSTIVVVERSS